MPTLAPRTTTSRKSPIPIPASSTTIGLEKTHMKALQTIYIQIYGQVCKQHQTCPGPVNIYIYSLTNVTLLLKAFSTAELSKKLNWGRFLITNAFTTDYMYRMLILCANSPGYRPKQRIITSICRYFTNMGMQSNNISAIKNIFYHPA